MVLTLDSRPYRPVSGRTRSRDTWRSQDKAAYHHPSLLEERHRNNGEYINNYNKYITLTMSFRYAYKIKQTKNTIQLVKKYVNLSIRQTIILYI